MKTTLRLWLLLLFALLICQFLLAGYGVGHGGELRESFDMHIVNGSVLLYGYLAAVVLALLARPGAKTVALTALGAALVGLQHLLAMLNAPGSLWGQSLFMIHALNGLGLIVLTFYLGVRVKWSMRTPEAARAA
ncbi:DUF6220 domain-containing protein [Salininema proteolyticum]|uniref:DUF6220 domain-containing protein n=1 Tax=Salininema proteolyticum TaxID=1607685 RepID=A0ABV8TXZ7_9ACTN